MLQESEDMMLQTLQDCKKNQTNVGFGPQIQNACTALIIKSDSSEWKSVVSSVTSALYKCIVSGQQHKLFTLPSVMKEKFCKSTANYVRNVEERAKLKSYLQDIISEYSQVFDLLIPVILRTYSYKLLAFTLRSINNYGKENTARLSETYTETSQKTDDLDFKQNMHYIGGSNIKSIVRKFYRLKHPKAADFKFILAVKERFLIGEFCGSADANIIAWTESQDRGGLLKINAKALDFFVAVGCIIKPLEHFDGSLYVDEVVEKVMSTPDLVLRWDDIVRGALPRQDSFNLLYRLCTHTCNTWRVGIVGRRKDEMCTDKDAPKHGTEGVGFRPKLST